MNNMVCSYNSTRYNRTGAGFFFIYTFLIIIGCLSHTDKEFVSIKWTKVLNTGKPVNYCQVDSAAKEYIVSYSHSYINSGGFCISRVSNTLLKRDILAKSNTETANFVSMNNSNIGFIQTDFEENTIRTKFIFSNDFGQTWNEIETPLKNISRFKFTKRGIVIEGYLGGTSQLFLSTNIGNTWTKIELSKKGVMTAFLIENNKISNNLILEGNLGWNLFKKKERLMLYNINTGFFKELLDFEDDGGHGYIKPISKNKNLHVIIEGCKLNLFSLQGEEINLIDKFSLPKGTINWDSKVYIGDKYYIVTMHMPEGETLGKKLSWISYDKGRSWQPYNQDKEFQLINSSFGELFMINVDNDIFVRTTMLREYH